MEVVRTAKFEAEMSELTLEERARVDDAIKEISSWERFSSIMSMINGDKSISRETWVRSIGKDLRLYYSRPELQTGDRVLALLGVAKFV